MDALSSLRVVLTHDWLTGMRGGEKVLEFLCRRWPRSPLYTLIHRKKSCSDIIENRPIVTSFLQWLPAVHRYYRYLLPLMPRAVRQWRVPECDLVLSVSHCVAKSIPVPAGVPHICYCNTPMRYAWHMRQSYGWRGLRGWMIDRLLRRLREWDRETSAGVTHFIANSKTIQQRILDCYGRSSEVIYPPVDTDYYCPAPIARERFYLALSAFAPYKRLDLAIEACNALKKQMVIIGTGQDEARLRKLAGPTIQFLGWQPDAVVRDHVRRCKALLFPGEEDFGIVPVEANACGTPVIAFGRGGATETIRPLGKVEDPTGVWFEEQTTDSLIDAMKYFERERDAFDVPTLRRHALQFNGPRFAREIFGYVEAVTAKPKAIRSAA